MRVQRLLVALLGLLISVAGAARADDLVDGIVADLKNGNYATITVQRTLLGRVRIYATGPTGTREIVTNPATGTVLRDHVTETDGAETEGSRGPGAAAPPSSAGRPEGPPPGDRPSPPDRPDPPGKPDKPDKPDKPGRPDRPDPPGKGKSGARNQ